MDINGTCIAEIKDNQGSVYVYQNRTSRILSFDGKIYQSAMKLNDINGLQLGYTQAMMLALAFIADLKTVTIMGLGAGSMVKNLFTHFPKLTIHAIEYRQAVINLAKEYFYLPEDKRLFIHEDDALHYIKSNSTCNDVIFSDLYNANGMDAEQVQVNYLRHCKNALNANGILVLNICHTTSDSSNQLTQLLAEEFNHSFINLKVAGGNTIVFAFKDGLPHVNQEQLMIKCGQLQEQMNIQLLGFAKSLLASMAEKE